MNSISDVPDYDRKGKPILDKQAYLDRSRKLAAAKASKPAAKKSASRVPPTRRSARYTSSMQSGVAKRYADKYDIIDVHPSTRTLVDQVLDPEDCNNAQRWPNQYGLSALTKCKNVINARFDTDSRSMVAVYPRLSNSIFTTAGASTTAAITEILVTGAETINTNDYITLKANKVFEYGSPIYFPGNHAVLPRPDSQIGSIVYPLTLGKAIPLSVGLQLIFQYSNSPHTNIETVVSIYSAAGVLINSYSALNNSDGQAVVLLDYEAVDNGVYLGISIGCEIDYAGTCSMIMSSKDNAAPWTYTLPNASQHCIVTDLRDASSLYDTAQRYSIISQSLLVTAQMSTTKDGGALAISRLPGETFVGEGTGTSDAYDNWYEYLASLPYDSHDGPTKDGGYSWYLGEDERSYFYRDVRSPNDFHMPYMASEFTVADDTEGSVVRIKVCTIVQFTTTSSLYDQAPAEYIDEWRKAHYLLSMVPAAYTNGTHKRELKKHLKSIAGKLMGVLTNPKTYTTAVRS